MVEKPCAVATRRTAWREISDLIRRGHRVDLLAGLPSSVAEHWFVEKALHGVAYRGGGDLIGLECERGAATDGDRPYFDPAC